MRKLIATTALALVMGGPALAQATQNQATGQMDQQGATAGQGQQMAGAQAGFYQPDANDLFLSNLMNAQVYAPQGAEQDTQQQAAGTATQAEQDEGAEVEVTVEDTEGNTETETITTTDDTAADTQPTAGQQAQGQVATGTTGEVDEDLQEQQAEMQQDQQQLTGVGETSPGGTGTQMMGGGGGLELQTMSQDQLEGMENIGSVNDIIVDEQGAIRAVVLDVGGFLGLGAREVALSTDEIQFGRDQEDPESFYVISQVPSNELENAPEFDRAALEEQRQQMGTQQEGSLQQNNQMTGTDTAADSSAEAVGAAANAGAAPMDGLEPAGTAGTTTAAAGGAAAGAATMGSGNDQQQNQMAAQPGAQQDDWRGQRDALVAPAMQREGYQQADAQEITADNILGANVYDANDENIGSVSDIVMGQDGEAEYAVIDVGGFLGFGSHTVAVGFDEMQVMHDEGWSDLRVYVDVTQEQLENMPQYEQASN